MNFKKCKRTKALAITSLILSLMFAISMSACAAVRVDEGNQSNETVVTDDTSRGEMTATPGEEGNAGINFSVEPIAPDGYGGYEISPQAESAYTVTATVTDENGNTPASIQAVTYKLTWADDGYRYGEDPDYYDNAFVSMTVDGTSATVACLQAFEVQIILTCTSQIDPTKKATVTFDYRKRLDTLLIDCFGNENLTVSNGDTVNVDFPLFTGGTALSSRTEFTENWLSFNAYNYGSGTVGGKDLSEVYVSIRLTSAFQSALRKTSTYSGAAMNSISETKTGSSMYGQVYSLYTVLIETLPKINAPNFSMYKYIRDDFLSALKETTEHLEVYLEISDSALTMIRRFKINFVYPG